MSTINKINVGGVDYDIRYYAHRYVIGIPDYYGYIIFEIICSKSELVSTYEELYELCKERHIYGYVDDGEGRFSDNYETASFNGVVWVSEEDIRCNGVGTFDYGEGSIISDKMCGIDSKDVVIYKESGENSPWIYSTVTPL